MKNKTSVIKLRCRLSAELTHLSAVESLCRDTGAHAQRSPGAPLTPVLKLCGQLRSAAQQRLHEKPKGVEALSMRWFGFGFNAFGQICVREKLKTGESSDAVKEVKVVSPTELASHADKNCLKTQIRASWSRRASLHLNGKSVRDKANFNSCIWTLSV